MSINDYRPTELATHRKQLSDSRESSSDSLVISNNRAASSQGKAAMINRDRLYELYINKLSSLDVDGEDYYNSL